MQSRPTKDDFGEINAQVDAYARVYLRASSALRLIVDDDDDDVELAAVVQVNLQRVEIPL